MLLKFKYSLVCNSGNHFTEFTENGWEKIKKNTLGLDWVETLFLTSDFWEKIVLHFENLINKRRISKIF